jgi:hypothetical protein
MIATGDQYRGGDREQFVQGIVDRLKLLMRERGWTGVKIIDVAWVEPEPGWTVAAPVCSVQIGPGHAALTVDAVRGFLAEKQRLARRQEALL